MADNRKYSDAELNELFEMLMETRYDDVVRAVKQIEAGNRRGKRSDKILQYYLGATNHKGGNTLTKKEMQELRETWDDIWDLGVIKPEWAAIYKEKTGEFDPGYIGMDLHYFFTEWQKINFDYIRGFTDKNYISRVLPTLRQPETLVRKISWKYLNGDFEPITLKEALDVICENLSEGVVAKISVASSGGAGVMFYDEESKREEIKEFLTKSGNVTVQKKVTQHPDMAKLNPSSINTVRLLTMLHRGECVVLSAIARIGGEGSQLDNISSGGMACGILPDGSLTTFGYTRDGTRMKQHPNGFVLKEGKVPNYEHIVEVIKKVHYSVPMFGVVSWDLCVGEDGEPTLIEYNVGQGGILTHQYNNGPLYGKYREEIIEDVFKDYKEVGATLDFNYTRRRNGTTITKGATGAGRITIPAWIEGSQVTRIADEAFRENIVGEVTINAELERIGYLSFYKCKT